MESNIIKIPIYKSIKYHRIYNFIDENISNENIIKKEEDIKNAKNHISINEMLK